MKKEWFELANILPLNTRPWIPLRQHAEETLEITDGAIAEIGHYVGVATLAVYPEFHEKADEFGWSDVGPNSHRHTVIDGEYFSADIVPDYSELADLGVQLVIHQHIESERLDIWHLHPDIVVALKLVQEGDIWYRPDEGWEQVVRLIRDEAGKPTLMEIRSEYLSDYLSARGLDLFMSSFRENHAYYAKAPSFGWDLDLDIVTIGRDQRSLRILNNPYLHKGYPFLVSGELWRTEWYKPKGLSVRVRGDKDPAVVTFAFDSDGGRKTPAELYRSMAYLYFKPELANALLEHKGSSLGWYTGDTGGIGASSGVHFGLNSLGLINIFAKDISTFPAWEQRIWSSFSVTPDAGVSNELFEAQMQCKPASSKAPESEISKTLNELDMAFHSVLGSSIYRDTSIIELLKQAHRFIAVKPSGLLTLSRTLTGLFAERLNLDVLGAKIAMKKGEAKLGSLKMVQRHLETRLGDESEARTIMAPLFGIQDLRIAGSHAGTFDTVTAMKNARVDEAAPPVFQGKQLLSSFVATLKLIAATIS